MIEIFSLFKEGKSPILLCGIFDILMHVNLEAPPWVRCYHPSMVNV